MAVLIAAPLAALAGTPQTVVLDMQNMTCSLCTVTVKKALEKVAGVANVQIDYNKRTATVKYDPDRASPATLVKATTQAGFPAKPRGGSDRR